MYLNKTFLAIIPARKGSKRLPGKNTLIISGKPLVEWTLDSALGSKYIDQVVVSTDDDDVIDIATKRGLDVPFKRPGTLATDKSSSNDVIKHTINHLSERLEKSFDYIIYLQPTSPLRTTVDIDLSIEYLFEKKSDAIISVCEVEHPVQWSGELPDSKDMGNFLSEDAKKTRSQDLVKNYRLNGSIYICDTKKFLEHGSMFLKTNLYAYLMNQEQSVDIDTRLDFEIAELLLNKRLEKL